MTQKNISRKNIVILGGGFCGLQTAKQLAEKLAGNSEYQIILVNKRPVHVYHADLYEISTAYNKRITEACLARLKKSVCVDIKKALTGFHGKNLHFLQDTITALDPKKKTVTLQSKTLPYEYLVLALGSTINYYGIPGLEEHSIPLKTLENALELNCHVDQFFRQRWEKKDKSPAHIVVGGGGLTGVEYACELMGYLKKLSRKYKFAQKNVAVSIIQAGPEFGGLGSDVSKLCLQRFQTLGVKALVNTRITRCTGTHIETNAPTAKKIPCDILIWAGGIQTNPLVQSFSPLHPSGAVETYPTLESPHYPKVYAGGDNAAIFDPAMHSLVIKVAPYAVQQGSTIAYNIWADITGHQQKVYKTKYKGYFLALGGKYFAWKKDDRLLKGWLPYYMHRWSDFRYLSQYMPFKLAKRRLKKSGEIFDLND